MPNNRRIDVLNRLGPRTLLPGEQNVELLSYRLPTDQTAELAALGTEVVPGTSSEFVRFTPYDEQTPLGDYYDTHAQPGTAPIPYAARHEFGKGRLFRLLVSNDDPSNSVRVLGRAILELTG